ncbi:hypothetical protein ACIBAG_15695 [Streptomyces sp. NPDC051243]|uniref:hypothetical protein n=1 Tax=Streptomyces sp. NPDC051243 TaxID=3365646 RepID=UPI0037BE1D3D
MSSGSRGIGRSAGRHAHPLPFDGDRSTFPITLPPVETHEEWDAVVPDETITRPRAEDLAARLGLGGAPLRRFPDGSQPVHAVGDEHGPKLFPGASARDGIAEGRVLSHVHGPLPVPTPRVHDPGAYENGWR